MYNFYPKQIAGPPGYAAKILLIMRLTTLILITAILQVSANSFAQKISLSEKNASLNKVFDQIRTQTGYDFFFTTSILQQAKPVTINVKNEELEVVLMKIFEDQELEYAINMKSVMISRKTPSFLDRVVDAFTPPVDVRGVVLDENGQPLPGVTVRVKGTSKVTSTGNDGRFYLAGVDDDAVIEFRMVGYKILELSAKGKFEGLRMEPVSKDLEEVVVAYGKTTTRLNTSALTVVKGAIIENLPSRSFDRSLQGLVPGLLVTSGTGQPGGGTSNIVLRGIGTGTDVTLGSTIRNPLFIIDGVQVTQDHLQARIGPTSTPVSNPLAQINPSDIETITVLKDAAAIALYGSRASNGVILVTTKKGVPGKPKFSFRHQTDISNRVPGKIEVLNQDQYLELLYESYKNQNGANTDAKIKTDLISKFPSIVNTPGDTVFYQSPGWVNELYNNAALTSSNDISVSGGNDFNTYYLNFEYTAQKGIIKKTGYDRTSLRYNFTSQPSKWFNFGVNSLVSYNKQRLTSVFEDGALLAGMPYTTSPLLPVKLVSNEYLWLYKFGGPGASASNEVSNPVAAFEYNDNKIEAYRGIGNVYAELNVLKSLKFRSNVGVDFLLSNNREKLDPRLTETSSYIFIPAGGRISDNDLKRSTITNTNTLNYTHSFLKNNHVNVILGQEAQIFNTKTVTASGTGLASPAYKEVSNATTRTGDSNTSKQTLVSYFGQVNYNFKEKYLLSLSGRKDGSSKFGSEAQYDNYWSLGAGYLLTEEPAMRRFNWLTFAKLRGSIGVSGSSNSINPSSRYDVLRLINYAGLATAVRTTGTPANPYIKAEETFNKDLGIEAKFFDNRIGFTLDLYQRDISNLLYPVLLPASAGAINVVSNIGDMENKGAELSLTAEVIRNKSFRWSLNANWSTNKNRLVKANNILSQTAANTNLINKVGENFNSFYLVKWAGVNQADGSPQWLDTLGNIMNTYSASQRILAGKPQPDGFGGITNTFNYKNLELSVFFYYQYGFQIYDEGFLTLNNDGGRSPYLNQSVKALDRWRNPGDQAANPKRVLNNPLATTTTSRSTRFLYDGDFIRLKNATIAYNLPDRMLHKIRFKAVKFYVQGNNLWIWTKFPGIDPEAMNSSGETRFPYPQQRTWSFGLQATL